MTIQYKALANATMGVEGRTVTGVFAVHGNVDDGGDRGHPGMFGDFTAGGRKRAVFLWQHRMDEPPIATIDRLFEVSQADLPAAVRLYAPDASGGVAVQRTYLETARGEEVLAGLRSGALSEMSYAYEVKEYSLEERDDNRFPVVRNIHQAELFDVSDVNLGMNPATSGAGKNTRPLPSHHEAVLAAVSDYTQRFTTLAELRAKEGRVLSGENRKRIADAVEALAAARDALQGLLEATDPGKARRRYQEAYQAYQETQRRLAALSTN